MNIFEQAARQKVRFSSVKGELTTEQLFDLPLTSRNGIGADLDSVAKAVNQDLKGVQEESFVSTKSNPAKAVLELKLEIVKHVIASKQAEAQATQHAAARADERRKLLDALADKQADALKNMSAEDIQKRLNELDA